MHDKPPAESALDPFRGRVFTGPWPNLPELLAISAERFPDRACLTVYEPDRISLTYREALDRIGRVAARLVALGVKPGDRVVVTGKNGPEWAVAWLAVLHSGAVVVPLDAQLHREETDNLLRAADARVAFVDEEKFDEVDAARFGLAAVISLSKRKPGYIYDTMAAAPLPRVPRGIEETAAILFTSGTTGTPKGVMLSHRNLVADCFLAQANLTILHTDVFYALLPLHHSYTMLAVFIEALSVGAEIVFGRKMATSQILRDLKEARITMFLGVPLLFNKVLAGIMKGVRAKGPLVYGLIRGLMAISGLVKKVSGVNPGKAIFGAILDKASLRTIRICISGGGPLAPSVFRLYNQLGIDFIQGYGLTETSPILTLNPVEHYKETSVGKLIPGVEARLLEPDAAGRGEISVRGPMVMQGYFRATEETAKVIDAEGWFRTGDIGWIDHDKYVYLTGRAKSLIVTEGGKNVYPEEIENRFQLHEEVEQVLVRGWVPDKATAAEEIEVLVYPSEEWRKTLPEGDPAKLQALVEERVAAVVAKVNESLLPYQRITRTRLLSEPMEMTTTKKIKRFAVN
jgi:long-chain acyl-CoA synthetase